MKKLSLYILLGLLIIGISIFYYLSKEEKIVANNTIVKVNVDAAFRSLYEDSSWSKWWPDSLHTFKFRNNIYEVKNAIYQGFEILIHFGKDTINTSLNFIPTDTYSTQIIWGPKNPQRKLPVDLFNDMNIIKDSLKLFLENPKRLYGIDIKLSKVTDTVLVSIRDTANYFPSYEKIYGLINKLEKYIASQGAKETNFPMLHVTYTGIDSNYLTQVAIPTNYLLRGKNQILAKQMVPGNILVAEVIGDRTVIENAQKQMNNFIKDFNRESPAIPFESMITNRLIEKDSTKWVTKIYYPIY